MAMWRALDFPLKGDDAASYRQAGNRVRAAIADGVGSYSGGGAAARAVIEIFEEAARSDAPLNLEKIFDDGRRELTDISTDDIKLGTTLTLFEADGDSVRYGHVGDCRIYHLRGDGIRTVTRDQTELNYLLENGVIKKYEARRYKRANVLMSLIAPDREFDLQVGSFDAVAGDRIILCSDGFYKLFTKRLIRDFSVSHRDFDIFADMLTAHVGGSQRSDDASAILVELD